MLNQVGIFIIKVMYVLVLSRHYKSQKKGNTVQNNEVGTLY